MRGRYVERERLIDKIGMVGEKERKDTDGQREGRRARTKEMERQKEKE